MYKPGRHVYLAAPFFNDEQREVCTMIEGLFEQAGLILFSPRNDGFVLKPDATTEEKRAIFENNRVAVEVATAIIAVIDDFDPGTVWEMGYGYAKGTPILAYSNVEGRGLNVMLAEACPLGFINGADDLGTLVADLARAGYTDLQAFPGNGWKGEIQ